MHHQRLLLLTRPSALGARSLEFNLCIARLSHASLCEVEGSVSTCLSIATAAALPRAYQREAPRAERPRGDPRSRSRGRGRPRAVRTVRAAARMIESRAVSATRARTSSGSLVERICFASSQNAPPICDTHVKPPRGQVDGKRDYLCDRNMQRVSGMPQVGVRDAGGVLRRAQQQR